MARKKSKGTGLKLFIVVGATLFIGVLLFLIFFVTKVDNGNVGVKYSMNGGVQDEVLGQGWSLTEPTTRVIEYPVRTQTKEYEGMSVATKDGKTIYVPISVNYRVDPEKASSVYRKFGNVTIETLEDSYIKTRINDGLRQTISKFSVIETLGEETGTIKEETLAYIKEDLGEEGFIVEDIVIIAPQPDEETQKAIDDRVKATQELERKKTDKLIATEEAERKKIEATGEAEANQIVEDSLTEKVLQQQLIEKWSGEQPISIGAEGGVIVDLPQSTSKGSE